MDQQEKNSTNAEMSSQNENRAVKLFPVPGSGKTSESNFETMFKDEFDGVGTVLQYTVEVAFNGFFVTISYEEPEIPDERYVVQTMDEVIELLRG